MYLFPIKFEHLHYHYLYSYAFFPFFFLVMGGPRVAQKRLLHIGIFCITMLSLILYAAYVSRHQTQPTTSSLILTQSFKEYNQGSNLVGSEQMKNESSAVKNVSVDTLMPVISALSNNTQDLTQGVPAETIYEGGHIDMNTNICSQNGKDLQLLIIITSAPSHEYSRMAIRQTWGHYTQRRDTSIAFMLGTTSNTTLNEHLENEQYMYGDIIRGKFVDTYENLTLKTISMLEWVDTFCSKASFVLKTDDDMFINVPRLLAFINKHNPEQRVIYGRLAKKWKPIRNTKSKYYISPHQYKPTVFPDFTTGPAYLLPARLSRELYTAALNHTYFKLEDVFVTGIVANSLKIKRVHVPEFLNKRVSLTPCSVQHGISIHMVKGAEQYDLWKKLLDGLTKCK